MNKNRNKLYILLICVGLVLGTLIAYSPLRFCEFIDYDDNVYITDNPHVQNGLKIQEIIWAFNTGHSANWHPLTWMSHMLDYELFGLNPLGHHGSSLLLHILNTLLLFGLGWRMTRHIWPGAFVAALFAWHPLHVESVAWVAERKDVLSTFFGLLSLWAYIAYAQRGGWALYLLTAILLALGLMAKPMLVTLPLVMLLLDYWPLERLQIKPSKKNNPVCPVRSVWYLLMEKIPLFMLSAASCVVTFLVQQGGGALGSVGVMSIRLRTANALVAYGRYIAKMFWPSDLSVLYLHPHTAGGMPLTGVHIAVAVALLLVVSLLIVAARKRRYLLMGWLWYLGTLVPVIGLVQVGTQAMADRYTYIPLIGLFIIIAWGAAELLSRRTKQTRPTRWIAGFFAALVLVAAIICTQRQLHHWRNSITLFEHALKINPRNRAIHNYLGVTLTGQGKPDQAISHYNQAININPDHFKAYFSLANLLRTQGKLDEAAQNYRRVLQLKPDHAEAHNNLGITLRCQGKLDEAIIYYRYAINLVPDDLEAYYNLADAFWAQGKLDLALSQYRRVLQIDPDFVGAHKGLASILAGQNNFAQAIGHYRKALQIKPNLLTALNDAAWIMATHPELESIDTAEMVRFAQRAAELTEHKNPAVLDTLAAAYARAGKFEKAVETVRSALEQMKTSSDNDLTDDIPAGKGLL